MIMNLKSILNDETVVQTQLKESKCEINKDPFTTVFQM